MIVGLTEFVGYPKIGLREYVIKFLGIRSVFTISVFQISIWIETYHFKPRFLMEHWIVVE